jgi:hypothetical protein
MYGNFVLFDDSGTPQIGKRVYVGDMKGKDEAWLRDTIFAHPEIIPIDDLDPTFGPLVPLCRELRSDAGAIDAVFISERGRLTIVECKLWKNPQARREVVAQTLDYVSALAAWSFADLQRQVAAAIGEQGSILDVVQKHTGGRLREREFVDAVSRSLREGRILVLIAGDGIREGMRSLTELVNRNATKAFSFGLIEVALYQFTKDRLVIQPRILMESEVVTREVVIATPERNGDAIQIGQKTEEPEEDSAKPGGKVHNKKWWMPLLHMKFDDPEQEPPFWAGTNNLVLKTPFPGILIKAASLTNKDYIEVFVSATRSENLNIVKHLAKRDRNYLLGRLPKGTVINHPELGWPVAIENRRPLADSEKYDWLAKNLNAFVSVLRPRLRKWYEETRD